MPTRRHDDDDDAAHEADAGRPSKSARKRAAHAAQDLGEQLVRMRDAELTALALPEALAEAIRAARRITSRAGLARQRQYIGKLMREVDPQPIRAALDARRQADAAETERFKRIEHWRERLVGEGQEALSELKRVSENGTVAEIKPAIERLQQASYKMAELLYKAAAPEGEQAPQGDGAAAGAGAGTNGTSTADDVIDAEFKEAK